jgi:DNA-binding beta-propeller fold protein YncE
MGNSKIHFRTTSFSITLKKIIFSVRRILWFLTLKIVREFLNQDAHIRDIGISKLPLVPYCPSFILFIVISLNLLASYEATAQSNSADNNKHVYSALASWGAAGPADGQLLEPADLSIDANSSSIYIADKDNNRIQKFDFDGQLLEKWGTIGTAEGQFNATGDVFVDSANKYVFVADIGNNRIQKFDLNGTFLSSWGSAGRGYGQFDQPGDIATDADKGLLFVTDIGNHRIQKFDLNGTFLSAWGAPGSGDGQLDRPAGIAYNKVNNLVYVADTNNNRIQKFNENGTFVGKWGSLGVENGSFNNPVSLAIHPITGNIFIADTGNKRIQELDENGNFISVWGSEGNAAGQFQQPVGVAITSTGVIYILDKYNTNIQSFSLSNQTIESISQDESKTDETNSINNDKDGSSGNNDDGNNNDNRNPRTESGTFLVKVKLDNVDRNPGDYKVDVTVQGNSKLHKSENVDTGSQRCPDDIDSQCYTPVGPFEFPAKQVPVGSKVQVCVREPISDEEKCNSGKNTSKKDPETIAVNVPDIPVQQNVQGVDNGDGGDGGNGNGNGSNDEYIDCTVEDCTVGSYSCPDDIESKCYKIDNE